MSLNDKENNDVIDLIKFVNDDNIDLFKKETISQMSIEQISDLLLEATKGKHMEIIDRVRSVIGNGAKNSEKIIYMIRKSFEYACDNNFFEIIKKLSNIGYYVKSHDIVNPEEIYRKYNLNVIKFLYKDNEKFIIPRDKLYNHLIKCYQDGQFKIVSWLVKNYEKMYIEMYRTYFNLKLNIDNHLSSKYRRCLIYNQ